MLELRILTGLHRGAALPLEGEPIRIGSGPENDLVLADPGMPARAGVLQQSEESRWVYRAGAQVEPSASASQRGAPAPETAVAAGARWFAGPVLIGCEEEHSPWHAKTAPAIEPPLAKRSISWRTKASALALAVIAITGSAVLIGERSIVRWVNQAQAQSQSPDSTASRAQAASAENPAAEAERKLASASSSDRLRPPARTVTAAVYPAQTVNRPPFAIRSASGGPYGFVVTDDGQVLMPGSRRQAFTLVRIEPGRAVFSGPYAAELTW